MKKFLLNMLACLAALFIFSVFSYFMTLIMFVALMVAGNPTPIVEKGSVLRISLNTSLQEREQEEPLSSFLSNTALDESGLDVLLTALQEAKTNDRITGVYLEGGALSADFASLQELRDALLDFKESGKFIMAYAEQYTQGAYYIAATADTILFNPSGMLDWHGIASQPIFYKDLLEKIGVRMQVFKVGTYKSAVEPYILTGMSEANREQVSSFVGDIWNRMVDDVAAARPTLQADSLKQYATRFMALADAQDYVRLGLVDSLAYVDGARQWLRQHCEDGEVYFATPTDVAALHKEASTSDDHVAVYYAEGSIVDEPGTSLLGGEQTEIVGSKVVADLDELAQDEHVKAVVLRINSGGGSAYASEQMWRAVQLLREKKPVVVSMSGMAASGGYYMSCGANYIVADATTLTGSIGIFGLVPDASALLTQKLGLHFDVVRTNEGADFGAQGRPFTPAESAAMQAYVERGYDLFLTRVADGRKMSKEAVDSIAQGRVWTGAQALKLGLVDELGTLQTAIAKAKALVGKDASTISTHAYPAPEPWYATLLNKIQGDDYMERKARLLLGEYYEPMRFATSVEGNSMLQARIPFAPNMK